MSPTLQLEVTQQKLVENHLSDRSLIAINRYELRIRLPRWGSFNLIALSFTTESTTAVVIIFHEKCTGVVVYISGTPLVIAIELWILDLNDSFVT